MWSPVIICPHYLSARESFSLKTRGGATRALCCLAGSVKLMPDFRQRLISAAELMAVGRQQQQEK
jgi:hypothetical protein